jgi:hypothetical protein
MANDRRASGGLPCATCAATLTADDLHLGNLATCAYCHTPHVLNSEQVDYLQQAPSDDLEEVVADTSDSRTYDEVATAVRWARSSAADMDATTSYIPTRVKCRRARRALSSAPTPMIRRLAGSGTGAGV